MAEESEKKATEPQPPEEQSGAEEKPQEDASSPEAFFDTDVEKVQVPRAKGEAEPEVGLRTLELLYDLDLPISVELARKEMLIRDILSLGEGSIVEFDKLAGEPVDLLVNNKKIAEGEVVVIEDRFGVRITNLVDPAERIRGLPGVQRP